MISVLFKTALHQFTLEHKKASLKLVLAKFSPEDAVAEHVKMKQYIQSVVQGNHDKKYVVVGHHSPSKQSTHAMYATILS
jgi:3-deoxy-D-arabino-heptulosonate 7-phosphate (DAHP) synthase